MSFYKHKSGAEKRRERDDKVKHAKKGERTLFDVGINVASSSICDPPEAELSNVSELDTLTSAVGEVDNRSDSYQLDSVGKRSDQEEFDVQRLVYLVQFKFSHSNMDLISEQFLTPPLLKR